MGRSADWRLSKETALADSPTPRESRRRRARRPAPGVHWRRNRRSSQGCPRATVRAVRHKASWVSAKGSHKVQPKAERRRSEEHTYELQYIMRISYAVFRLKKNN